jgi:hypothetical protein
MVSKVRLQEYVGKRTQKNILSAIGAVLLLAFGAIFTFYSTERLNAESKRVEIKSRAYEDYLQVQAKYNAAIERKMKISDELITEYREGSAKVALFGSPDVVHAFANVARLVPHSQTCVESYVLSVELFQKIREDTVGKSESKDLSSDIALMMFFCTLK